MVVLSARLLNVVLIALALFTLVSAVRVVEVDHEPLLDERDQRVYDHAKRLYQDFSMGRITLNGDDHKYMFSKKDLGYFLKRQENIPEGQKKIASLLHEGAVSGQGVLHWQDPAIPRKIPSHQKFVHEVPVGKEPTFYTSIVMPNSKEGKFLGLSKTISPAQPHGHVSLVFWKYHPNTDYTKLLRIDTVRLDSVPQEKLIKLHNLISGLPRVH
ncbi:uncharacterized protein MEPE_04123 [Melanopsichium pennsylvanicum]|uniref:Uncharacterized protein n=2 Tax=Melanopsichium pennsylvanicum TaxID=63383 RepID=A0AAJ4XN66_9BASI|nr:uncharacterized protein BN887_02917 [Melanopsichium pennsylvanicum 4]SNX85414.1 uncharacterized protein MEPE_04123 [Melanopsichium pennsylvanicum]